MINTALCKLCNDLYQDGWGSSKEKWLEKGHRTVGKFVYCRVYQSLPEKKFLRNTDQPPEGCFLLVEQVVNAEPSDADQH